MHETDAKSAKIPLRSISALRKSFSAKIPLRSISALRNFNQLFVFSALRVQLRTCGELADSLFSLVRTLADIQI